MDRRNVTGKLAPQQVTMHKNERNNYLLDLEPVHKNNPEEHTALRRTRLGLCIRSQNNYQQETDRTVDSLTIHRNEQ